MKNQIIKYIHAGMAAAMLLAVSAGCNKGLDLKPLDAVTDATFWKDPAEFKLAANNFYAYLRTFSQSNSFDGSRQATDLGADRSQYARGTNTVPSTDGNYSDAYRWIRSINYMLSKAVVYAKPDEIKQYVAEAKFFRAYVYFDKLLTSYGGVILIDKLLNTESPELFGTRSSRDATIDFIIKDLEEAIPDLPLEKNIVASDKGRISQQAAQAFLGRVSLYEGTWQKSRNGSAARYNELLDKSIANSNAVIASSDFELFRPAVLGDSALKYMFILENQKSNPASLTKNANREYILAVRYESANLLKTIPNQISFGALGADVSRKMADMYLCEDGLPITESPLFLGRTLMTTEFLNRDNRMRYYMCIPRNRYWQNAVNYRIDWKGGAQDLANARPPHDPWNNSISGYENQQWSAERQVPNHQEGYDYPVIRLAEVYLNYAEAVYERNGAISDADLDRSLNLVRNRVNTSMPKLSNALVTANSLNMQEEIRRERAVELQGEGFRMDDLKRWHIAHIELNKPVLGIKYTGTEYATQYPTLGKPLDADGFVIADPVSERKFTEKNYLLPIPSKETQINAKLDQNPGWQ